MGSFGFGKRRHCRSALAFYQSRDLRGPLGRILGSRCGRLTRWFLCSAGKKHWMLKPRLDPLLLKCLESKVRTPSRLLKSKLRGRGPCASREETEGVLGRGFLQTLHVTVHQDTDEEVGRRQWGRRRDDRHTPRRRNNATLAGGRHSTRGISSATTWRYAAGWGGATPGGRSRRSGWATPRSQAWRPSCSYQGCWPSYRGGARQAQRASGQRPRQDDAWWCGRGRWHSGRAHLRSIGSGSSSESGYSASPPINSPSIKREELVGPKRRDLSPGAAGRDKRRKEKAPKKRKRVRALEDAPHAGDLNVQRALEDSKGTSTRDLQSQLLRTAAENTRRKKEKEKQEKKRQEKKDPGLQLVKILTRAVQPQGERRRSSSQKRDQDKKKEKKKKKDKRMRQGGDPSSSPSSSQDGSGSSRSLRARKGEKESSSSSSDDKKMIAPLRRRSKKRPGSVLTMLLEHARAQLDQSSKVGISTEGDLDISTGVKMSSYYAIVVKPTLGNSMAQIRELHHISQCIDLLRQGDLDLLGDVLAGRFISLHQSVLDGGWSTARHLELLPLEEGSAASPEVVLQAQRHAKLAAKVAPGTSWNWGGAGRGRAGKGRGSWSEPSFDSKGKGKKGPKGRGKGKNWGPAQEKESDARTKERVPEK